ncbi:hypothetical protein TNCV_1004051 [Trichonephila clavipes]|nr:hypothetical protein TNCV_1004051 [Trichonephila clavipes]
MYRYPKYLTQDLEAEFSNSKHCYKSVEIQLSTKFFFGELQRGEKYQRDWLPYLKLKGHVFCFYCLLLQPDGKHGVLAPGCNDRKNSFVLASQHERSDDHTANVPTLLRKGSKTVQNGIQSQYDKEVKYWRDLLTRIVSIVKFLLARGLLLRCDDQHTHTTWIYNKGAFLTMP